MEQQLEFDFTAKTETPEVEEWKDIPEYEGIYQVSNKARVRRLPTMVKSRYGNMRKMKESILKPLIKKGYCVVALSVECRKKYTFVHRLVAEAFIPNPENKPFINHKNCIRHDNRIENIEWCTAKENSQHASMMGRLPPITTETRKKMRKSLEKWDGGNHWLALKVRNKITGQIFDTVKEAAKTDPRSYVSIQQMLKGTNGRRNLSPFEYYTPPSE